jgi:PAS domain S-box-containing protein
MKIKHSNIKYISWLSLPLLVICGILQLEYPAQFFSGYGFVVAVIFTYFSDKRLVPLAVAAISTALIFIGIFCSGQYNNLFYLLNHLSSLMVIVMALYFVLYVLRVEKQKDAKTRQVSSLINFATEGIILTNDKGKIILANPHAQTLFGYSESEMINNRIEMLLPEAIRERHVGHVENFHQKPSNRSMGAGRDLYAKRKDGSVFPVEISLSYYHSGKEAFVIAFIIDITIRKENEKVLNQKTSELEAVNHKVANLNIELEQKVQDRTTMLRETLAQLERSKNELAESLEKEKELGDLKSRFVSTVSHEFRTPLSTILSSASLIGKYLLQEEQPKREKHITRIKESVKHMTTLLEDLLQLGKLEEGLLEVKTETFEFPDFMQELVSEMQALALKGQNIIIAPITIKELNTDKRLLKNVMINLISNAIKFSPENSDIHIIVISNYNKVSIAVKDSGIGIPKEDLQHLFERFFRARSAHNIPGTGLGLHIVGKYLELMGGSINVATEPEKGSTFTISLPLTPNEYDQHDSHTTN